MVKLSSEKFIQNVYSVYGIKAVLNSISVTFVLGSASLPIEKKKTQNMISLRSFEWNIFFELIIFIRLVNNL